MTKTTKIILATLVMLILYSCCKDPKCPTISEDDKTWLPYSKGDSIVFKSDSGKISHFVVKRFFSQDQYDGHRSAGDCPENCFQNYAIELILIDSIARDFGYVHSIGMARATHFSDLLFSHGYISGQRHIKQSASSTIEVKSMVFKESIEISNNWLSFLLSKEKGIVYVKPLKEDEIYYNTKFFEI